MKPLSTNEKQKILTRIFWDLNVDDDNLLGLLNQDLDEPKTIQKINFYRRLLLSCDWYTLLKLVSKDQLETILSDTVIDKLYPEEIKKRFQYARKVLQG